MAARVEFKLQGEALPADVRPSSYEIVEGLSRPYEMVVEFATADGAFTASSCLRKGMTLDLVDEGQARSRSLSGVCEECELVHHDGTHFVFRARLRPPFAALSEREDCRIYQDKSVVDVLSEVLAAAGVDKVELRLVGTYPKREYIVQYRESEADFVHRLCEDEGIFYFYEHDAGETTMVFADSNQALEKDTVPPVTMALAQGLLATDPITDLRVVRRLRTSAVHLRDYDFEKPQRKPEAIQPATESWPMPYYDYPAGFVADADGKRRAEARLRSLRADAVVVRGSSQSCVLEVAKVFTVVGAAQEILNGRFVVTKLRSRGRQSLTGRSGEGGSFEGSIENGFEAVPEGSQWAPPRKTKRPRIHGIQPAVVTGPTQGEEQIHVDSYGRIKVRFLWDRVGQHDDKSSCWLRVVQPPLGGSIIHPRVGWEVAVAFFDGDPDRPFVQSRLYNAERTPPYALPGTKTSGSIRSASSPGGAGHNEVLLADSGGSQGFSVHAQKDLNITVRHDQNETVGVDDEKNVKVNTSHSVGASQSTSVGSNQTVDVGAIATAKISGNLSVSVGGNCTDNATSNYVEKVGGDRSYSVGGNLTLICNGVSHNVDGNLDRTVGAAYLTASVGSIAETVGGNATDTIGAAALDLCKGSWGETIGGNATCTLAAADVHLVKGTWSQESGGTTTLLTGGLHYQKITGDYSVKAPMITLLGAVGVLKGGGSELKLGGGPVVLKGSKTAMEGALIVKMGSSLKLG